MGIPVLRVNRRQMMPMMALAGLGLLSTKAPSATTTSILSPTRIWNREFNPNSALRPWSINANGDLAAPTSLRFELHPGDQTSIEQDIIDNRERSEISGIKSPLDFDRDYNFTSSFNLSGYTGASTWLIFMQVKQTIAGENIKILSFELRASGKWRINVRSDSSPVDETSLYISPLPLKQGVNHSLSLLLRIGKWGRRSELQVKLDGTYVLNMYKAPLGFAAGESQYFKMGLYRPASSDICVIEHLKPRLVAAI